MGQFDRNEQDIHNAFSQINVDASKLAGQVKRRLKEETVGTAPRRVHRSISAAAAIVISVMLVGTATAMALGGFDWFIEKFNPSFGTIVEPVGTYCEDQGIHMEVIGAQKYGNMAMVYLSLQDISGQNRLTERTDFRDGFSVTTTPRTSDGTEQGEEISSGGLSWKQNLLYFDDETNTLYYEFNITADANSPLSDPLEIGSFLIYFDEREYNNEPISISLSDTKEAETISIKKEQILGWRGSVVPDDLDWQKIILTPGNLAPMPHGDEDQWISNIGVLDGRLHVQIARLFNKEFGSNSASISLQAPDGKLIQADYELTLIGDKDYRILNPNEIDFADAEYRYQEIIFPVNSEGLDGYTLCYTGSVYSGVEGRWKVVANLSDTAHKMRIITEDISFEGHLFKHMILSPLGLQVMGSYKGEECMVSEMVTEVETADGIIPLERGGGSQNHRNHTFNFSWNTKAPLDISKVKAIIVDGARIPFK